LEEEEMKVSYGRRRHTGKSEDLPPRARRLGMSYDKNRVGPSPSLAQTWRNLTSFIPISQFNH